MKDFEELSYNSLTREQQLESSLAFPVLMRKVYVWMTLAMIITGFTAYYVATSQTLLTAIYSNSMVFYGLILAEFALVFVLSSMINKLSLLTATLMFVLYSVVNGATLSFIFLAYTASSITSVFFITAATFASMALYGYFTKKDLSSWGRILTMGLIGIVIASLVNIFLHNSGLNLIISYVGVLVFVGLTAYDTQKIKQMMLEAPDAGEHMQKIALLGALSLYLDFINLFLMLLRILGSSRD
jgi:FtsH-binding integral membrane protein